LEENCRFHRIGIWAGTLNKSSFFNCNVNHTCFHVQQMTPMMEPVPQDPSDDNIDRKTVGMNLQQVARRGRLDLVLSILRAKTNPNDLDSQGMAAIHYVCKRGRQDIVLALLEYNTELELCNFAGYTPLAVAAERNHLDLVTTLIRLRANPDSRASHDRTPLHRAAASGHEELATLLVRSRADTHHADDVLGETALHHAARGGHVSILALLIGESRLRLDAAANRRGETGAPP
jgi:ankyrin repeat protein